MVMPLIDGTDYPHKTQQILSQSMSPDTILLNLDSGYYYSTNPVGEVVWECCDGEKSVHEIIAHVSALYDISPDEINTDILDFLSQLKKEGLIQIEKNKAK